MVIIIVFLLVAHQPFDRFIFLIYERNQITFFLLLMMEVYFYSYFIVFVIFSLV